MNMLSKLSLFIMFVFIVLFIRVELVPAQKQTEVPSALSVADTHADKFTVIHGKRQLFLDDYAVQEVSGLVRTMHQPEKKGAVIKPDPANPEVNCIQIRTAPIWDPQKKVWKLWDCSTPNDLHAQQFYCSGYYESRDGLNWIRPIVDQIEYHGSKNNNYISIMIRGKHYRPDCVVYDPTEPDPAQRYKTAIGDVGFAVSPDGIHWKEVDIPGVKSFDEYNFSFDRENHLFIFTVKLEGPHGRSVWLSTSDDFKHWTKPELIFSTDDLDQTLAREIINQRCSDSTLTQPVYNNPENYNADVYNMGLFRYEGLYIGVPAIYHATGKDGDNTDGFHLVQLVCSRDLHTWQRLGDRKAFIGPSKVGGDAYDLTQIIGPSYPVVRGNELWLYYTGLKYRSTPKNPDPYFGAVCLAVLRRDGFVSLDAGEKEGWVLTKLFEVPKGSLHINVDASHGRMVVQVYDEKDHLIPGFETSETILGNHFDTPVHWKNANLRKLIGKKVRLRITLQNAQLYSFWIQ